MSHKIQNKNARTLKLAALAPVAAGLFLFNVGCGKDGQNIRNEVAETTAEVKINDQWVSQCKNVAFDLFNVSSRTERYDIGASLSLESTFYAEDNCVTPVMTVKEVGTYTLGDRITDDTFNFDKNYASASITPLNEQGRDLLNTVVACGINDWQVGVARDVTAATSDNPLDRCWIKTPRNVYDIANVTGDELHFGRATDDLDKSSPEKRPIEADVETKLTRE